MRGRPARRAVRGYAGRPTHRTIRATTVVLVAVVAAACTGDERGPDGERLPGDGAPPSESLDGLWGVAPLPVRGIPSVVLVDVPAAGDAVDGPLVAGNVAASVTIDQFGLTFSPRAAVVAAGGTVTFTNSESSLTHNVHVRSIDGDSVVLDADAATGESIDLVLSGTGGYDVTCDVHPGMTAFVYVTDARHAAFADGAGRFHLPEVDPGPHTISVWSIDETLRTTHDVLVDAGGTEVRLVDSR